MSLSKDELDALKDDLGAMAEMLALYRLELEQHGFDSETVSRLITNFQQILIGIM